MKKEYIIYFIIVFASLLAKLYFIQAINKNNGFENNQVYNNGDSSHYIRIAKNLKNTFDYTDSSHSVSKTATWRPPIWPIVLAFYMLFSSSFFQLMIIKVLFETLFILLLIRIVVKHEKTNSFIIAALLLLLFEPQFVKYSTTFLSESLSSILLLAASILFYLNLKFNKVNVFFPILCAVSILCHPVSFFYIGIIFIIHYVLKIKQKTNRKKIILQTFLFCLILMVWPLRNSMMFNQGFYLTASQGATFSKGWNDKVIEKFNNTDGDLADETLNLKYLADHTKNIDILEKSKIYKKATFKFISSLDSYEILKIASTKIKSNFIPYPEKPKNTNIDALGTLARIIYLILLIQSFYILVKNGFKSSAAFLPFIVLSVYLGQSIMAVYIYTGLRFNAIYGLTLLFCLIMINKQYIFKFKQKNFFF